MSARLARFGPRGAVARVNQPIEMDQGARPERDGRPVGRGSSDGRRGEDDTVDADHARRIDEEVAVDEEDLAMLEDEIVGLDDARSGMGGRIGPGERGRVDRTEKNESETEQAATRCIPDYHA